MKRNNTYKYSNFLKIDEDTRRDRELLNSFLLDKGLCHVGSERYISGDYRLAFKDEILKEILQELYDEKNYEAIPKLKIPKIKAEISRITNRKEKINYLNKVSKEFYEELDSYSDIYKGYKLEGDIKVIGFNDLDEYILSLMKRDYYLVLSFLTLSIGDFRKILQGRSFDLFRDYNRMNEVLEAQEFILEFLWHKKNDSNHTIFVEEEYEDLFHKILLNENVITEQGESKRGFQTVAYNFFCIKEALRGRVFKKKVTLKDFALFLEDKYYIKIKNPDKMASRNHLSETISKEVELLLESKDF